MFLNLGAAKLHVDTLSEGSKSADASMSKMVADYNDPSGALCGREIKEKKML